MRSSMGYVARILASLLVLASFSVAQDPTITILEGPVLSGGEPDGVQVKVKWDAKGNPNYESVSIYLELVPEGGGSETSGVHNYQSSPGDDVIVAQFGETTATTNDHVVVHATFYYSVGDPKPVSSGLLEIDDGEEPEN